MDKKFKVYTNLNLSQINKEVLEQWRASDLFGQSLKEREGCPSFVFYEGPPSANGMPGIHHVMARTIKDIVCRYKTMKVGTPTDFPWSSASRNLSESPRRI